MKEKISKNMKKRGFGNETQVRDIKQVVLAHNWIGIGSSKPGTGSVCS